MHTGVGEWGPPTFYGTAEGETFEDACSKFFEGDSYYRESDNTYWACYLYTSEPEAIKAFFSIMSEEIIETYTKILPGFDSLVAKWEGLK